MSSIDEILASMREAGKVSDMKGKGTAGEDAIVQICLDLSQKIGGKIYQSFAYPYQTNSKNVKCTGNIKLENGHFVEYTDVGHQLKDEIDVLYITPYRIFAIEVKSYHASIELYDNWVRKNKMDVDKSPIAQAEKHVRHLYHAIAYTIPDGNPNYIIPMCVFVDRCTLIDNRSDEMKKYIPATILNNFKKTFVSLNTPLEYRLDIGAITTKLHNIQTEIGREF